MSIEPRKKVPSIGRTRQKRGEKEKVGNEKHRCLKKKIRNLLEPRTMESRSRRDLYQKHTGKKWKMKKIAQEGAGLC